MDGKGIVNDIGDVSLDESSLITNQDFTRNDYREPGSREIKLDTNKDHQTVLSLAAGKINIYAASGSFDDSQIKVYIYSSSFLSDGTLGDWTEQIGDWSLKDERKYVGINTTYGDRQISAPYAVLWKVVAKPFDADGGWLSDSIASFVVGYDGIDVDSNKITFDYASDFQYKNLIVFKGKGSDKPYDFQSGWDRTNTNGPEKYLNIDKRNLIGTQDGYYGIWFLP